MAAHKLNQAHRRDGQFEDSDEEEEEDDSLGASDRIRRSYHGGQQQQQQHQQHQHHQHQHQQQQQQQWRAEPETIRVTLNESYFANERRLIRDSLANVRQKLSSLQMFNPAKNASLKEQQQCQGWSEKEKYTLDSLNEFRGQLDQRFQWNRPEDGREVWPSKLQYFLAITSYSIGLGNVIRFPMLVQRNGGLAFVIPFVIMLLLEGIPLFYLELAIGQRTRKAAISCWHSVSPFAAGIGLASAAVSLLVGLYYNAMVAWTLLYSWSSLTGNFARLAQCPAGLESERDRDRDGAPSMAGRDECQLTSPFEFHWHRATLNESGDASDWSPFNWPVALCLTLAWLLSYVCLVRGLSSSKRLVYAVSVVPYVILAVFFFKALGLRGMGAGVRHLLEPDWPKLLDPFVWLQAAAQVFFSLGLGFGGLIALSSYNAINNNCYKDAIRVSLINFLVSILAGVVVFALLGFKAGLNFERCQLEREQQIDFYLADYNLKALDYGAVFEQVPVRAASLGQVRVRRRLDDSEVAAAAAAAAAAAEGEATTTTTTSAAPTSRRPRKSAKSANKQRAKSGGGAKSAPQSVASEDDSRAAVAPPPGTRLSAPRIAEFMAEKQPSATIATKSAAQATGTSATATTSEPPPPPLDQEDEFSADDAIASIANLDRQLDLGSPSGSFDYGDSDTEFVLNASHLISGADLERIVASVNNLRQCSVARELDESSQGTGLVFVALAEAVSRLEVAPDAYLSAASWAVLFFLMILTLGLDSQFGNLEGLLSALTDLQFFHLNSSGRPQYEQQPQQQQNHHHDQPATGHGERTQQGSVRSLTMVRQYATGLVCLLSLGLSMVLFAHGAGLYMFAIFDEYASNFSLVLIALFELLAISHVYGLKRFCDDCELMTGRRPPFLVLLSWRYISPSLLLVLVCTTLKQFTLELNYDAWPALTGGAQDGRGPLPQAGHTSAKPWPSWAILFGLLLVASCVLWIPLVAILRALRIKLIPDQDEPRERRRCWFPVDELREFHQLQDQERQVTKWERILFGFRQDDD